MLLAVFHEFAHPEVLEKVRASGICDVDVAPEPTAMAAAESEKQLVRTNAKLITVTHTISGMRDVFDTMTAEDVAALNEEVDLKLDQLIALGFEVMVRHPTTSAGCPMLDRVILTYPE